jgi:hypothetical protein
MFRHLYQGWLRLLKLLRLKRNEPVSLNAGILIIGSLLWDLERGRPAWRDERLEIASAQTVTAPIRYGRLSDKRRGYTYTMVFSRLAETGRAKVVRCRHSVSTAADLIAEAECLWKAEQPGADQGRIAADWGCVGLLCNPDRKVPEGLLKAWSERVQVKREPSYGRVSQAQDEGRLIDENGLLLIDWPICLDTGQLVQLDLLLVTANDPEISTARPNYPDVAAIAGAWNAAASKHAEYFWKNLDNGIRTFQDDEIRALLHPRGQGHA